MKKSVLYLLSFTFFTVYLLTSCVTSKLPEGKVEDKTTNYKLISVKENLNYLKTEITYPEFESYPEVNKIVQNTVLNNWKSFKSYSEKEWNEINSLNARGEMSSMPKFEYLVTPEVKTSKNYISILLTTYVFTGGAHGNQTLITYTYNTVTGKFENIEQASGYTINEISQKCRSYLYKVLIDENKTLSGPLEIENMKENINTGAFPQAGNFEIFTLNKDLLTVYFEPYSVAPYVYGIQTVDIKVNK